MSLQAEATKSIYGASNPAVSRADGGGPPLSIPTSMGHHDMSGAKLNSPYSHLSNLPLHALQNLQPWSPHAQHSHMALLNAMQASHGGTLGETNPYLNGAATMISPIC